VFFTSMVTAAKAVNSAYPTCDPIRSFGRTLSVQVRD